MHFSCSIEFFCPCTELGKPHTLYVAASKLEVFRRRYNRRPRPTLHALPYLHSWAWPVSVCRLDPGEI